MQVSQALDVINNFKPNQIETLADLLPLDLINKAYALTDTVTIRARKLTLESMAWLLVGMAIYNDKSRDDYNIWYSDRINDSWSEPIALDSIINSRNDEFFPSLSNNGNLYFTATRDNGIGKEDIFISEFIDGEFQSPKPLPTEINTLSFEFNAYINPEENLIIFSSFGRSDGYGGGDLYISRKDKSGKWTKSKNLGELINSDKLDYCPFVDWKSRNLYFTSERKTLNNKKIENVGELIEFSNSPLNGFGNIYKIGFDKLE